MEKLINQLNKAYVLKQKQLKLQVERGSLLNRILRKYEQNPEGFSQLISQNPDWEPFIRQTIKEAKNLRDKTLKRLE